MLALICSCGSMSARIELERGVAAVKNGNYVAAAECFGSTVSEKLAERELDERQNEVYLKLVGRIKIVYTGDDISEENKCEIPVELEFVDLKTLYDYVSRDVSVFGVSSLDRIEELLNDGTIDENFILTERCTLVSELSGGKYIIDLSRAENAELCEAFGFSGFVRWLENQD